MMLQPPAPRVQDHQPADVAALTLRMRGDVEQALGGGAILGRPAIPRAIRERRDFVPSRNTSVVTFALLS